jgi:hypothetical protein
MSDTPSGGFGKFVPGFEFLQNLAGQAASGAAQGPGGSAVQLPNLGHWVAPTFNVQDLEKRIEELKAVHFWLDQNAKALGATIQALEVQKMTLVTLESMNFNLGDVANAFKIKPADTVAGFTGSAPAHSPSTFAGLEVPARTGGGASPQVPQTPQPAPDPAPAAKSATSQADSAPAAGGQIDPMHWWGALSQQFQTIATHAMKDVGKQPARDTTREAASGLTSQAVKAAAASRNVDAAAGMGQAAARAETQRSPSAPKAHVRPAPKSAAAARRTSASTGASTGAGTGGSEPPSRGEWPLPTAFFQVPGFPLGGDTEEAAKPKRAAAKKAAAKPAGTGNRKAATKQPAARASAKTTARKTTTNPASKRAASRR